MGETPVQRTRRRAQRLLFDELAELYAASRHGYPDEIVDEMLAIAQAGPGSPALEIGCGTGQLTRSLAARGLALTAIDIAPAMVRAARRGVPGARFAACAFEDFDGSGGPFDLIASATAFHWIDPEIGMHRVAELLRPGGWFALLMTGEAYEEPFGTTLRELWIARSEDGGAWAHRRPKSDAEKLAASGLFETPVERAHAARLTLPVATVLDLEHTRATVRSYSVEVRAGFGAALREALAGDADVSLTQHTRLTLARLRG